VASDSSKFNPLRIVRVHYGSFVNQATRRRRWRDYLLPIGIPLVVAALCLIGDVQLTGSASAGLLTVSGLIGAFLFGVMLQVSQRAMEWADASPAPSRSTTDHAELLRELSANAGYASLVCIAASASFVVAATTATDTPAASLLAEPQTGSEWPLRISSALGLALVAHMVVTLLMVMKRIFAVTEERLNRAQTGADQEPAQIHRRRVS